jgi:curved DNA-binding protein CbpA
MNETYYYRILGLKEGATIKELKKAFHEKAKEYHPDVSSHLDAESKFIEVNEAYEYLRNKQELDQVLRSGKVNDYSNAAKDIIDKWLASERERIRARAAKHAGMTFRKYKNTSTYRATEIMNNSLYYGTLLLGMLVMFGPIFGAIYQFGKNPLAIDSIYLTNSFIVFLVGIIMTGYSTFKLSIHLKMVKKLSNSGNDRKKIKK